jgi:hypothetical protein
MPYGSILEASSVETHLKLRAVILDIKKLQMLSKISEEISHRFRSSLRVFIILVLIRLA